MKKIIPILILSILIIPIVVLAEEIKNPITAKTFQEIINNIINFIFNLGLAATPLMVLIGGFFILTAGGDPKRVDQGRKIIIYAMIGLFIILFSKGIISILNKALGVKTTA